MNVASFLTALYTREFSETSRYRLSVAARTLAAIVGGYVLTSLFNIAMPLLLGATGVNVPQALLAATTISFLLWAAIIMAVFHARCASRAWGWLLGASIPLGLIIFLLLPEVRT